MTLAPSLPGLRSPTSARILLSQFKENPSTLDICSPRPAFSKNLVSSSVLARISLSLMSPLSNFASNDDSPPQQFLATVPGGLYCIWSWVGSLSPVAMVLTPMKTVLTKVFLTLLTNVRTMLSTKHPTHCTAKSSRVRTRCCLGTGI